VGGVGQEGRVFVYCYDLISCLFTLWPKRRTPRNSTGSEGAALNCCTECHVQVGGSLIKNLLRYGGVKNDAVIYFVRKSLIILF